MPYVPEYTPQILKAIRHTKTNTSNCLTRYHHQTVPTEYKTHQKAPPKEVQEVNAQTLPKPYAEAENSPHRFNNAITIYF